MLGEEIKKIQIYVYVSMYLGQLALYFEHMESFNFLTYQINALGGLMHVRHSSKL